MNIEDISRLMKTQDNRATRDPIFIVQQRVRTWGIDSSYSDDYQWMDEDYDKVDRETARGLDAETLESRGYSKVYYRDDFEFVTACFTEKGCEKYIAKMKNRLTDPRVYVDSAYRNDEWIFVTEHLKALTDARESEGGR